MTASTAPRTEQPDIAELVKAAQGGDMDAFGGIYRTYRDPVYGYIRNRVSSRELAEDLTSDTFVRVLRHIGTFRWQNRDFGAWLFTIARNLITDHYKSHRARREVCIGEMFGAGTEPAADLVALALLDCAALREAVGRLTDMQQQCIRLRFLAERSIAETAAAMGVAAPNVKSLQWRAVQALGRDLARRGMAVAR